MNFKLLYYVQRILISNNRRTSEHIRMYVYANLMRLHAKISIYQLYD